MEERGTKKRSSRCRSKTGTATAGLRSHWQGTSQMDRIKFDVRMKSIHSEMENNLGQQQKEVEGDSAHLLPQPLM